MTIFKQLIIIFSLPLLGYSQTYTEGNKIQTIRHQVIIPEDGSLQELKLIVYDWTENVLRKNQAFDDIQMLFLESESDTLELLVLYKYSNLKLDKTANQINQELISNHWPKEGSFDVFIKKMWRYIDRKQNVKKTYHEWLISSN